MLNSAKTIAGAAILALGMAGMAGCDSGQVRDEQAGIRDAQQQEGEQQAQDQQAQEEGVVAETVQPTQDAAELGDTEAEEGQTGVQVRRRVVTTELEEVDVPTVSVCQEYADLNRMDANHFVALGVSQEDAQQIVNYRDQQGEFASTEQLSQVPGLEQGTISRVQEIAEVNVEETQQQQAE